MYFLCQPRLQSSDAVVVGLPRRHHPLHHLPDSRHSLCNQFSFAFCFLHLTSDTLGTFTWWSEECVEFRSWLLKTKNLHEGIKLSFCAYRTSPFSTYLALPCWCKHSPSPLGFGEHPLESKAVPAVPLCPRQHTNRGNHFWCFRLWYYTTGMFLELVLQGFVSSSFRYLHASPAEAQERSLEICRELSRSEAYHWCDPGDAEQCDGIPGIPT